MAGILDSFAYMLAPLEDMTDPAFRTLCFRHGADITFTPMIRVEGLAKKNAATWSRLEVRDNTPTIVQLLVGKEKSLAKFLSMFEPFDGFKGFNLNLGCPSPEIIMIGQGCAMVKRVAKVSRLVTMIKESGHPVSVKLRLGLNHFEKEKKAYLNLIKGVDADFFIVHARHGAETYAIPADPKVYPECVETGKMIIANGDISIQHHIDYLKKIGVKGVMIGRAAVSNPGIFSQLKEGRQPSIESLRAEYQALAEQYGTPDKYKMNIFRRLGADVSVDDNRLI